ncbi:MAG: hypothetical protein HYV40_00805 [Candidatus Levybacteria bacterium]|nr:hypothetical protein [Candidatus Levybacteria bacterium]
MDKKLLGLFLYWRLFLFLPLFVANMVIPARRGYEYTLLSHFINGDSPLNYFLLSPFVNFDGVYYLMISGAGYTVNAGFFPLFPLVLKFLNLPFGTVHHFTITQYVLATILVNVIGFLVAVFFYKLVRLDYDKEAGFYAVLGLLFFPTAFFLASFYSEGLFLLLTIVAFLFARKKKWVFAGISGVLLTATRVVGIAILPALLVEWYIWWKSSGKKFSVRIFLTSLLPTLMTPLGLIGYMVYNAVKWGDALYFVHAQGNFANSRSVYGVILLPQTLVRYAKILTSVSPGQFEWWIALLEVTAVLFGITMLFVAWKKKVRVSYLVFAVIAFLIPSSTGTFTGMPRYVLVLFPIFIALTLLKNSKIRFALYAVFFVLQILLFTLFAKGYFIS